MSPRVLVTLKPDPMPTVPIKPNRLLDLAVAASVALVGGFGFLLLWGRLARQLPASEGSRNRVARVRAEIADRIASLGRTADLVVLAAGLAIGWVIGWAVSTLTWAGVFLPIVLILIGALGVLAIVNWRAGVYVLLLYTPFDGLLTMPLYPSTLPIFRYVLLACVYIGYLRALRAGAVRWPLTRFEVAPFLAVGGLCALDTFNPHGIHLWVAAVGSAALLGYLPMYVVGRSLAQDPRVFQRIAILILVTSVPVSLFGIWEWRVGADVVMGWGPGFEKWIWVLGPEGTSEFTYRPASTFAFISQFASYLVFVTALAWAAVHMPFRLWQRAGLAVILIISAVAVVVEAARTDWVLLPLLFIGMYVVNPRLKVVLRMLPALAAVGALAVFLGRSAVRSRLPTLASQKAFLDHLSQTVTPFRLHFWSWDALWGHGTGSGLGASRYATGTVPTAFESGWYVPFFMFGLWGLVVFGWLYGLVLYRSWRGVHALPADRRWMAAMTFVVMLITAAINTEIVYTPFDLFFWLFAGLVGAAAVRAPVTVPEAGSPATTAEAASLRGHPTRRPSRQANPRASKA
jgi:hypothetical protein